MCKQTCVEGLNRILCSTCHNWFHFDCINISRKTIDRILISPDKKYTCQVCKTKSKCCSCGCSLITLKPLYCLGCLQKFCQYCHQLDDSEFNTIVSSNKAYFCKECSIDHFCNECNLLCETGCIFCDSCHSWVHYKCTKLKKSQIISYAKTTKKYYCSTCIEQSIPFTNLKTSKLDVLNSTDHILNHGETLLIQDKNMPLENSCCNLCLECNPECSTCLNNACVDPSRVCETCLICDYIVDTNELNQINDEFSSKFRSSLSAIHFNARSLQKHHEAICK